MDYTDTWFDTIVKSVDGIQTGIEIDFLTRNLPRNTYQKILDIACGNGRHSCKLLEKGYEVTGIDINRPMLEEARGRCGTGRFLSWDMREIPMLGEIWDACIIMWQSFGHFEVDGNENVLRDIYNHLKPRGRLVLDIYNKGFFENHQGVCNFERKGHTMTETKFMKDSRLFVDLEYGVGFTPDHFEWELFNPDEIQKLLESIGFKIIIICSEFIEDQPAKPSIPRMQIIAQKST